MNNTVLAVENNGGGNNGGGLQNTRRVVVKNLPKLSLKNPKIPLEDEVIAFFQAHTSVVVKWVELHREANTT